MYGSSNGGQVVVVCLVRVSSKASRVPPPSAAAAPRNSRQITAPGRGCSGNAPLLDVIESTTLAAVLTIGPPARIVHQPSGCPNHGGLTPIRSASEASPLLLLACVSGWCGLMIRASRSAIRALLPTAPLLGGWRRGKLDSARSAGPPRRICRAIHSPAPTPSTPAQ